MTLKYILISELAAFVESVEFNDYSFLPITKIRAYSQINNPSAAASDVALILAFNDSKELVGYIGILPSNLSYNGEQRKVFTNSGWWVHSTKGRKAAMPLFYAMIELVADNLFFADLTPHTTAILQRTGLFHLPLVRTGFTYYFRLPATKLIRKKFKWFSGFPRILTFFDDLINLPFSINKILLSYTSENHILTCVETAVLDSEIDTFIQLKSESNSFLNNYESLKWAITNPWLRKEFSKNDSEAQRYYFSTTANTCQYKCFKIYEAQKLVSFFILFNRDGNFKLPFFLADNSYETNACMILSEQLVRLKANAFTTWQDSVNAYFTRNSKGVLLKKQVEKQEAYSIALKPILENYCMQDGDGDMIFT